MPSVFDTQFAESAFQGLLDLFGESITYWQHGSGRRTIDAIIERNPPAIFNASGDAVVPTLTIRVYNSNTTGIRSRDVDIGKDEIECKLKIDDALPKRFSLLTLVSQDAGVTQLALI